MHKNVIINSSKDWIIKDISILLGLVHTGCVSVAIIHKIVESEIGGENLIFGEIFFTHSNEAIQTLLEEHLQETAREVMLTKSNLVFLCCADLYLIDYITFFDFYACVCFIDDEYRTAQTTEIKSLISYFREDEAFLKGFLQGLIYTYHTNNYGYDSIVIG